MAISEDTATSPRQTARSASPDGPPRKPARNHASSGALWHNSNELHGLRCLHRPEDAPTAMSRYCLVRL